MYEGSRHQEIAAMLSPGEEPQPQRLLPGLSVRGSDIGRGGSEPLRTSARGVIAEPEQPASRPRPNLSDAV